jgi:predicted transcriptional regulator
MRTPKITRLEMKIMEIAWERGARSIREIQESFSERRRPAYATVQTTVYRMEAQKVLRLVKKDRQRQHFRGRRFAQPSAGPLIDELLHLLGGRTKPLMAHLVNSGKLTLDDVKEAEQALRDLAEKEKPQCLP